MDGATRLQSEDRDYDLTYPIWPYTYLPRVPTRWWHLPILAAAVFYVAPGLAALGEHTAYPIGTGSLFRSQSGRRLADYYLTDFAHAALALTSCALGAALVGVALERFEGVVCSLIERGLITAPRETIRKEGKRLRGIVSHPLTQLAPLAAAVYGAYSLWKTTRDDRYENWWAYRSHPVSGWVLVIASGSLAYFGGGAVIRLAVGVRALTRLMHHPVHLLPAHHDGCNGFGELGDYLLVLFTCGLAIAASVWVTFESEYPKLEDQLGVIVVAGMVMASIPIFLFWPAIACTWQIARARDARVAVFDDALNHRLRSIEEHARTMEYTEWAPELEKIAGTRKAVDELFPSNPFPFRPRLIGAVSVTYLVQLVLFLERIATAIRSS